MDLVDLEDLRQLCNGTWQMCPCSGRAHFSTQEYAWDGLRWLRVAQRLPRSLARTIAHAFVGKYDCVTREQATSAL